MPRSTAAYFADIIESTRPSVEREFIIIGEAVSALGRVAPDLCDQISHARMVVGFRNVLTHDYAAVDDETVFGVARDDILVLRGECVALLQQVKDTDQPV